MVDLTGVQKLDPDTLVEMDIEELRTMDLPELLKFMHELGLSVEGIAEQSAALTRIVETAVSA